MSWGAVVYGLLFPVVPDVLHIVVIFHDVDELFHQLDVLFALQLLIVLGNHFDLGGNEGVLAQVGSDLVEIVENTVTVS